ncbi:MAG: hypothetical protein VW226_12860 [Rhodospirillaceae bacterium]|jgi:hypothetical protein
MLSRWTLGCVCTAFVSLVTGCNYGGETTVIVQPPPAEAAPTAVKKRSYISGEKKVCVYSRMGTEEQIVISATDICPLKMK